MRVFNHTLLKGHLHSPQKRMNSHNSSIEPTNVAGDLVIRSRSDSAHQVKGISCI